MKNDIELRNELAGRAMEGMLAAGNGILTYKEVAEYAYDYADALMEEGDARARARDDEILKQYDLDPSNEAGVTKCKTV